MKNLKEIIEKEIFATLFSPKSENKVFVLGEDLKIEITFIYPEIFLIRLNDKILLRINFDICSNIARIFINTSIANQLTFITFNKDLISLKFNSREKMFLDTSIFVSRILKAIFAPLLVL